MALGFSTGFLAGVPFSFLAVLDGILSGIMGGMMGAMLGEMVPMKYWYKMLHIIFVLFVAVICLILYILQLEVGFNRSSITNKLFHNPLSMLIIILLFFYIYNHYFYKFDFIPKFRNGDSHIIHFVAIIGYRILY